MIGVLAAGVLATGTPSLVTAQEWIRQSDRGDPVAAIGLGAAGSITIICEARPTPAYRLQIRGPARGLKAGEGVVVRVHGRRKVKLRFDRVTLQPGGMALLSTHGATRGSTGDQSGALEAIEAIRTARDPITVVSGPFRVVAPAAGVDAAMEPLIRRCGRLGPLIKRAEGREGQHP